MSALGVAIVGARGRMGRLATRLVHEHADLGLCAEIDRGDDLEAALRASGAEVGLDLTVAGEGHLHAQTMLSLGIRPVIGTSGVSRSQNDELDRRARELGLGGLVVPNFSLGVWVMSRACELAAQHFASAEIVEMHNVKKVDAPSGTAVATAELIADARGIDPAAVPIHSLRLPGLYSNQEVHFGGEGEVLVLRHETYDVECFAAGILAALRYAPNAVGVARGIGPAFEARA